MSAYEVLLSIFNANADIACIEKGEDNDKKEFTDAGNGSYGTDIWTGVDKLCNQT